MSTIGKSLLAGTALSLLLSAPALAGDARLRGDTPAPDTTGWGRIADPVATVDNGQTSSDALIWTYSGNEADAALAATSVGVGLGNTASAVTDDVSVQVENTQALDGRVETEAQNYFREAGLATSTATTYGNSFTAESGAADIGVVSDQTAGPGTVKARALIEAGEYAASATGTATAGANTVAVGAEDGYAGLEADQSNLAAVDAIVEIAAPYADVPVAVGTAIAVINNADVETRGDAALAGRQSNAGNGNARTQIQLDGTFAAVGTSAITGNNLNMINEGGVGALAADQSNSGDLFAQTIIDVGAFPGDVSGAAMAIGNSASAATTGPASSMHTVQNNSGAVIAQSLFTGDSGLTGASTATAYGNAVSGTLCECDGELNAYNRQANSATVRAHTYNLANDTAALTATSVAAGNTATYRIGSPEG